MNSKSIGGNSPEEIKTALDDAMIDGFIPTLAIVFASISQDIKGISKILANEGIVFLGATTNGEFTDENVRKGSIAILLMDLDPVAFKIYLEEYPDNNCRQAAMKIATQSKNQFDYSSFFIAASHLEANAEEILYGFQKILGQEVNIFGCMAGDDFSFNEQFVFTNNKICNRAVVALTFDEQRVEMKGRATCGWKSIGTEKLVTKSEGNRVYTINDIPALDITAKYGGITDLSPDNKDLLTEIATNCTIQLQRENGESIMRPGLVINWEDHSFICSGSVPQGSKIKFSLPPDFDAIEKVVDGCKEIKKDIQEIDALVYITCAGRLIAFGPLMTKEIAGIKEVWNVPMVGMFSNAELGRAKGGNLEMHNLSSCVITLREK